jgi:hypothetical protein
MPIIKLHQQPLLPEGEYCGQAHRVVQEWTKPRPRPDGTTPEPVQLFRVPLWIPGGKSVTAFLRVTEASSWVWEAACRSGEIIPQTDEFRISPDDFENRRFYFGITHREYNGVTRAEVRFHTPSYAIRVNPALEHVTFPNEAPRPLRLQAVTPTGLTANTLPSPEPSEVAPPKADSGSPAPSPIPSSASTPPLSSIPPVSEVKEPPVLNGVPPEGITAEEFREALEYAQQRRAAGKQIPPKTKAA